MNAIYFACDHGSVSPAGERLIAAAGGIVNVIAGFLALALLRVGRLASASGRYFLWLLAAVNLCMAFGYLLFSGLLGLGDWVPVFAGLAPMGVIRTALAVAGGVLYFLILPRWLAASASEFIDAGANAELQEKRLMRLPYLVGGVLFVVASLPNPEGIKVIVISAVAASFGGISLLAWYPFAKKLGARRSPSSFGLERSVAWTIAAVVTAIVFIVILGRGISF